SDLSALCVPALGARGLGHVFPRLSSLRHLEAWAGQSSPEFAGGMGDRRRRHRRRAGRGDPDGAVASLSAGPMTLELSPAEGIVMPEEPLSRHTTWRIGGPARWFCRVRTEEGLSRTLEAAAADGNALALLGMGSNVLVADEGFPGYLVRLEGDFLKIEVDGTCVMAGGGAALGGVCAAAARAGLSGLEAISGIPSSIGGAVRINAGAYGGEIFDVLKTVRLVSRTGRRREIPAAQLRHGYRWSELVDSGEIVASAALSLTPAAREAIEAKTRQVAEKRRGALPAEPN